MNITTDKWICPLTRETCFGKACPVSVLIDLPDVQKYDIWKCGLCHTKEIYEHGKTKNVDIELALN